MDEATVLQALARVGKTRRFFAPEHAELLAVARPLFIKTFNVVAQSPWFDLGAMQSPVDFMAYMECILRKRPRVIFETGTASGAGALFYAEVLKRVHGDDDVLVITVDVNKDPISPRVASCPQITSLIGSSVDPEVVNEVRRLAAGRGPVMVTLDSDHSAEHVAREIGCYADLVSSGQYLIVQDTYLGLYWGGNLTAEQQQDLLAGRPGAVPFDYIGSPLGAVEAFLSVDDRFSIDMHPQRWIITQCPFGYLLKSRGRPF